MDQQRDLINQTGRVVARQIVTVAAVAALAWYLGRPDMAKGLGYGGGLAALLAAMLSASLQRAADHAGEGGARILYRGAVERFVVVGVAVILAAAVWGLHIGGVIGGLIIAHVVSFIEAASLYGPRRKTE
ncbi:ATP synthase subunit I [Thiohalorhabdus denitrificans]|uniref:ATP synthase I chain n=1 Tax=Thiohalorhabdus denitrificans TaxID=381306 RepID=A0A1G5EA64_9GAMM|nr:ATP synthase subunit I [Thiohalorhabdus denitrificans]SCY23651.1 ATP synthase I chain [Thiohalorhabdus denitrificans]